MNKKMSHKPTTNAKYPSFSFIDINHAGKQKITWIFSYSVPTHNHNDVGKQNKHSCDVCDKVFTSNKALNEHKRCHSQNGITNTPTAAPSSIDDQFPPPKKRQALRRKRYMDIDDDDEGTVAETLLHISRGGYEGSTANIDVNHSGAKRQKIPSNMDLNELPSDDFEYESN
jgi:hypothetical protein